MASKITSNPTLMMNNDMLESSMGREPQSITRNQDSQSDLVKCIIEALQQFSKAQMNLQELSKEDPRPDTVEAPAPLELSHKDVQEFQAYLSSSNCDQLLEMVNGFPAQLFLQTFDEEYSRSALHVAILEGSQSLIHALMEKLKVLYGGSDSKLAEHEFILKQDACGLSAIDMATLIGDKEIISYIEEVLQVPADLKFGNPLYQSLTFEAEKTNLLKEASLLFEKPAPTSGDKGTRQLSLGEWLCENNVDFVYCLHEAVPNSGHYKVKAHEFVNHVYSNRDFLFLKPLLKVRDSLGKSLLHVHVENPYSRDLVKKLITPFPTLDWNVPDFNGRTPLHWAAAQGDVKVVIFLANKKNTDLNTRYTTFYGEKMKANTNFNYGGVHNVTPLHLAVIHNHVEVVKALLEVHKKQGLDVNAICWRPDKDLDETSKSMTWTPIQLAAYMGYEQILEVFLEDPRIYDPGLKNGNKMVPKLHNMISALHLAASQFHPLIVKALVASRKMDTLIKDEQENEALHYATKHAHGRLRVHANLYDYVTVPHFTFKPPKPRKPSDDDIITCIDILMQSGLHMQAKNKDGRTPTLHPSSPEKVQTWWLGKMAKEYQEIKNNLITAANAVSVTAALVATASFVGPLQPPLGLLDDGSQTWLDGYSKVKHTSVQVFLICDSLSFYLAIAAIVLAMLPSWPIPHEGIVQEVSIARRCVQGSVLLLFGSIVFVVCAFSAASIAIVPDQRWQYMTNAVISTSLGVLISFFILLLSFTRLLALFPSNNEVAKKISDVATRILLWEPNTSST